MQSLKELLANSEDIFLPAIDMLLKLAYNIVNNPNNDKFRKIRVDNKQLQDKLISASGAIQCMFEMGFKEDGEFFTFPNSGDLRKLEHIIGLLHAERNNFTKKVFQFNDSEIKQNEMRMYTNLKRDMERMETYEDKTKQAKARSVIPLTKLVAKSQEKFNARSMANFNNPEFRDVLVFFLLEWFKMEFFKWVDTKPCENCTEKTSNAGLGNPSPIDLQYGALRIELHKCNSCQHSTRFPRYNDPAKLLETRCGRCGEWANCFCLCLRSLDFETRYVSDNQDHVWCEFYSDFQNRWIHLDPCENAFDTPLIYEAGWGKKHSYIFATSYNDLQDVTWRYSSNHKELLKRRTQVRESWLVKTINDLRNERRKKLGITSPEKLNALNNKIMIELAELLNERKIKDNEIQGRTSGSLAWRLSRGETGDDTYKPFSYIFKPTKKELDKNTIHVQYQIVKDEYFRVIDESVIKCWNNALFECKGIFMKKEMDWKMVYLARNSGVNFGKVVWKFDLNETENYFKNMTIKANYTRFENGKIDWAVCCDNDSSKNIDANNSQTYDFVDGKKSITISAFLSGGKGDLSWQHAQLFRTSLDSNEISLDIYFKLRN